MTKPLLLKATEGDEEETQEMTAANEISLDAAVAVSSQVDGILTLKEERITALRSFLDGKDVFGFNKSLVRQRGILWLATGC